MPITNTDLTSHPFLISMYADDYFPRECVDRVKSVLVELCEQIERDRPTTLAEFYVLSHAATDRINDLEAVFADHGSEIETVAREAIAEDFARVASAYGFDADIEELIATRQW